MNKRTEGQPYFPNDHQETQILPVAGDDATEVLDFDRHDEATRLLPRSYQPGGTQKIQSTAVPRTAHDVSAHHSQTDPSQNSQQPHLDRDLMKQRRTRPTTWAILQHLFALLVIGALLVAILWFFVCTQTGQQFDESSFEEFSYQFMGYQSQTMTLLDLIPAAAGVLAVIGILFVLLWKHRFVPALVGLAVALASNGSTQIIKNYLLTKPNFGIQEAISNSAPSGHTTFAAGAGAALFLASPKKLRPVVALLGAFFSLSAGFSTVINGWHRPADVVSAILLTSLWTIVGLALLRFMRSEELDMSNTRNSGLILVPLLSIAGFFMGFCTLALYIVTYYDPIPGGALMASTCMILSAAAFTTSAQIALLRPQNKVRSAYTKVWTY